MLLKSARRLVPALRQLRRGMPEIFVYQWSLWTTVILPTHLWYFVKLDSSLHGHVFAERGKLYVYQFLGVQGSVPVPETTGCQQTTSNLVNITNTSYLQDTMRTCNCLPAGSNRLGEHDTSRVDSLEGTGSVNTPRNLSDKNGGYALAAHLLVHTQEVDLYHALLSTVDLWGTVCQATLSKFKRTVGKCQEGGMLYDRYDGSSPRYRQE